jgi:V/A-type H+-transporting ATPase subunit I
MIRPRAARWFQALVARVDATVALEALASTGAIELETSSDTSLPAGLADLNPLLAQYAALAQRYRAFWPADSLTPSAFPDAPVAVLTRDLVRLRDWARDAEPLIVELQAIERERAELELWRELLRNLGASPIPLDRLNGDGELRGARLFAFGTSPPPPAPEKTLLRPITMGSEQRVLAIGPTKALDALAEVALSGGGRVFGVPTWLESYSSTSLACIASRMPSLEAREAKLRATLSRLADTHDLRTALGDARRLSWVIDNVRALEAGDHFCFITGWTSELDPGRLVSALERSGARALLRFTAPPAGSQPPLLFANPAWVRPFEIFASALGMPSRDEVDSSLLLAFTVPLLFGYMFGDVGQGLVIAALGFLLRKRFRIARLFVSGGLCAALFGLLFGSAFSLHDLPALWVQPLERPLDVLAVPLVAGAVLLALGLLLSGLEAWWRESFDAWLATEAPLLVVYAGVLCGFVAAPAWYVALAGAVAYCTGHAMQKRKVATAGAALAELVERTVQLLINTLSFARVGAFALAHAGLSSAIVALMDASDSAAAKAAVLVAGNVVVIVLETLVVSIQTTRLVLFEFFTRFVRGSGRVFRPLPTPPSAPS